MKRVFIVLALVIVASAYVACTGGGSGGDTSGSTSEATETTPAKEASGPPTTVFGKITLSKKAPKPKKIRMSSDPGCEKAVAGKDVFDNRVVVGSDKSLANVFVVVKGKFPATETPAKVVLDQKGCRYHPHVIAVQTDQEIEIKNSDPFLHNVNAMAKKNPRFNSGMTGNQTITKSFKKPESMIKLRCDVHGWMSSYISVVDHPYFAVTGTDGQFEIPNVPGGEFEVEFHHEKFGKKTAQVKLAGGRQEVNFQF